MPSLGRTFKRRLGIAMMAGSLMAGATLAGLAPAAAQEEPTAPEETTPAEVERAGYYQAPRNEILPATLVSEFPPGVVCIVAPELCPEEIEPVSEAVEGGLGAVQEGEEENQPEAAPLPPDSLPVSATGGKPDYRSAVQFSLPSIPDGKQVDSYKIYLTETQPTYSESSPAFRQAVLAALTCARECDQEQFERIGETQPSEQEHLEIEVCPIADDPSTENRDAEWEGEDAQRDAKLPDVNCLYGANGVRIDRGSEDALWEVDLTFALQAWSSGEITPNGVLIRPRGLPNLAFGDPDTTFNKQVVFTRDISYTLETSDEPEPPAPLPPATSTDAGSGGLSSGGSGGSGSSGGFSAPASGGGSSDVFSAPARQTPEEAAAAPQVADDTGTGDAGTAGGETAVAAGAEDTQPGSAWWVWLLVPVFAGGMYMFAQSLSAPVLAAATDRAGAMTRLIEKRRAAGTSAMPELLET